jgi:hypothetical protein
MTKTIAVTNEVTTLINILTVEPENQQKLIHLLRESTDDVVSKLNGWISTSISGVRHLPIWTMSPWVTPSLGVQEWTRGVFQSGAIPGTSHSGAICLVRHNTRFASCGTVVL